MPDYRLYFLQDNHIRHVVTITCEEDAEAIELVEKHRDGRAMELWERDRLVKRFDAKP